MELQELLAPAGFRPNRDGDKIFTFITTPSDKLENFVIQSDVKSKPILTYTTTRFPARRVSYM